MSILRTADIAARVIRFYRSDLQYVLQKLIPDHWTRHARCRRNAAELNQPFIHRVKWRHSNLWSRYDLNVVRHDVVLWGVDWWRFVTLSKYNWISRFKKALESDIFLSYPIHKQICLILTTTSTTTSVHPYLLTYLLTRYIYAYYWLVYTQCRGKYCFALLSLLSSVVVVCCRRLLSSVTLHGGSASGFTNAGQAMTSCCLQSNCSSTVTLHGGPVVLRPVRATRCSQLSYVNRRTEYTSLYK